jgi:hypothetical protein
VHLHHIPYQHQSPPNSKTHIQIWFSFASIATLHENILTHSTKSALMIRWQMQGKRVLTLLTALPESGEFRERNCPVADVAICQ